MWEVCASQSANFIVLVTPSLLSLLLNQPSDEFETIQVTGYLFLPFPITMGIWLMQCEYKTRDNGGIFVTECNMLNKSSLFSCNSWNNVHLWSYRSKTPWLTWLLVLWAGLTMVASLWLTVICSINLPYFLVIRGG